MNFKVNIGTVTSTISGKDYISNEMEEKKTKVNNALNNLYQCGWSGDAKEKFEKVHAIREQNYTKLEAEIKFMRNVLDHVLKTKSVELKTKCENFVNCIERNAQGAGVTGADTGFISFDGFITQIDNSVNWCVNNYYPQVHKTIGEISELMNKLEDTTLAIGSNISEIETSLQNQAQSLDDFDNSFISYYNGINEMETKLCSEFSNISGISEATFQKSSIISSNGEIDETKLLDIMSKNPKELQGGSDAEVLKYASEMLGKDKVTKDYNDVVSKKLAELMSKPSSKLTEEESYYLETIKGIIGDEEYNKIKITYHEVSPSMHLNEYNSSEYPITITQEQMDSFVFASEANPYTAPIGLGVEGLSATEKLLSDMIKSSKSNEIASDITKAISEGDSSVIINTASNNLEFGELLPESALNKRQRDLLDLLRNQGDTTVIRKKSVSMNDLRQLTNVTGDEFNMFTNGGERLIIRGKGNIIEVTPEMYEDLLSGEYGKFSGHTHPGYSLDPGPADEPFLDMLGGQKRSSIWGNSGRGWEPFGCNSWETEQIRIEMRREEFAKLYGGE